MPGLAAVWAFGSTYYVLLHWPFSMPQILISDVYYGLMGCMPPIPGLPGFLVESEAEALPPAVRMYCRAGWCLHWGAAGMGLSTRSCPVFEL